MSHQIQSKIAPQGYFRCHPGDKVIWFVADHPLPIPSPNSVAAFMVCEAKTPQLAQDLVQQLNDTINYTELSANMTPFERFFAFL
ncbi:hypothetical protein PCC7424_2673 [Gloeothece citriformis PCC 7424]|uniref:Uncharacterized protein n=1 Tax=Gloeothece citriformis (strain PCC 7424) TaxID=65393 RepID=B7KKW6_GLOC7|nr:hypothetical protein [Gloeothece citriformis]ACK71085.1 hypothetical protein PCC7424_2673 [Gloeothece citriformis PCC 7424]